MNDFQAIADRVEIEALRSEFTDAAMMRDRARLAALFTSDGVLRMPDVPVEFTGPEEIRAGGERLQAQWDFFIQNTHQGAVEIDGDTATGRAFIQEIARLRNGFEGLNYAIYHDRYRRTADGWKFAERVYEIRYLDITPLGGSAPGAAGAPGDVEALVAAADVAGTKFTEPASADRLERTAAALTAKGFAVEILGDAAAARARVKELIPLGASVFTAASETLRLSGLEEDINAGGDYQSVKSRAMTMDRETEGDELRRLVATPDFAVGSVTAVTEAGALVIASASGSQLPGAVGGAACAIWVVGAQKVVADLDEAMRRVEQHALPLEDVRAREVYGVPSAVNQLLILNAPTRMGRGVVVLLREAIGF
ncbi:LUD domain-containing protein [Actinospica robiniae]|uniref:LUD domain-containing protein n=1 Tax=Actinospica robiniae TaxID=304901 RepID=UPI000423881B|nr:LUD domain-containing protein [Actinospica robiniae]